MKITITDVKMTEPMVQEDYRVRRNLVGTVTIVDENTTIIKKDVVLPIDFGTARDCFREEVKEKSAREGNFSLSFLIGDTIFANKSTFEVDTIRGCLEIGQKVCDAIFSIGKE